jgi:hypothetical protein
MLRALSAQACHNFCGLRTGERMSIVAVDLTEGEVRTLLNSTGRGHQRPTKHTKNLLATERKLPNTLHPFGATAYRANWQRDGSAGARKAHKSRAAE